MNQTEKSITEKNMVNENPAAEKEKAVADYLGQIQEILWNLSDQIYDLAEPGLQEVRSAALLEDFLEKQGFAVERGVGGLDTAFRAVYEQGQGGPSFGLLAEYDALEGIGHGCGHHMQGPGVIGAALAVRHFYEGAEKPFKLVIYGTPAEETCGGKTIMMENGCFQDIDVALMMHGGPDTCVDVKSMASREYTVKFHGKKSHAAMAPEEGRSALDAAVLAFHGVECLREHVREDTRMHQTILDAGGPANVVPETAEAQFVIRSYDTDYLETLVPRLLDIFKGACLMTGTAYEVVHVDRFYGKIPCLSLNRLIMEEAEHFEAPQLAPPREKTGSTDFGIILYNMPGSCIRVAFVPRKTAAHTQEFLDAGKTAAAHNAVTFGAEILAGTCIRLLDEPGLLEEVQEEFRRRKCGEI